jgi:hypothetical protein
MGGEIRASLSDSLVCPSNDELGTSTTEPSVVVAEGAQIRRTNIRVGTVQQLGDDQKRISGRAAYLPVETCRGVGYRASRESGLDLLVSPLHDELWLLPEVAMLLLDAVHRRWGASGLRSAIVQLSADQIRVGFDEII